MPSHVRCSLLVLLPIWLLPIWTACSGAPLTPGALIVPRDRSVLVSLPAGTVLRLAGSERQVGA